MKNIQPIFLVDDDEDDRLLLKEAFASVSGQIPIIEIQTGYELVELLDTKPIDQYPSLILLDMNMPRMSGLEVLSVIKHNQALNRIPIIMVSTSSSRDQVHDALEQGVAAYITKPITMAEYLEIAREIVRTYFNE